MNLSGKTPRSQLIISQQVHPEMAQGKTYPVRSTWGGCVRQRCRQYGGCVPGASPMRRVHLTPRIPCRFILLSSRLAFPNFFDPCCVSHTVWRHWKFHPVLSLRGIHQRLLCVVSTHLRWSLGIGLSSVVWMLHRMCSEEVSYRRRKQARASSWRKCCH